MITKTEPKNIIISIIVFFSLINIAFFTGAKLRAVREKQKSVQEQIDSQNEIKLTNNRKKNLQKKNTPVAVHKRRNLTASARRKTREEKMKERQKEYEQQIKNNELNRKRDEGNGKNTGNKTVAHNNTKRPQHIKRDEKTVDKPENNNDIVEEEKAPETIFTIAKLGLIGLGTKKEFDNLYDYEISLYEGESPIEKLFGKLKLEDKKTPPDPKNIQIASTKPENIRNPNKRRSGEIELGYGTGEIEFNKYKHELFAMGLFQTDEYILVNSGYEVKIINKDKLYDGEINVFSPKVYSKLKTPLKLIGHKVVGMDESPKSIFMVSESAIFWISKKGFEINRIPLHDKLKNNDKWFIFKYFNGFFHFLTDSALFRYNIRDRKWYMAKYELLLNTNTLEIYDYCVERKGEIFYYWVSTLNNGVLVLDNKGIMKGALTEIPINKDKIDLTVRPVSLIRNILGDLYFFVNAPDSGTKDQHAFVFRYSKKFKKFEALKNPVDPMYYYQSLSWDKRVLILIHDIGFSIVNMSKLKRERKYSIMYNEKFGNLMWATVDGRNVYFIDYDGLLVKYDYSSLLR